jgi:hypothetical protein
VGRRSIGRLESAVKPASVRQRGTELFLVPACHAKSNAVRRTWPGYRSRRERYYVETMDQPSPLWRLPASGGGVPLNVLEGVVLGNF